MSRVDKEALFQPNFAEQDVEIPGRGTVRVRAMSRADVLEIRDEELPVAEMERKLVSAAMVEPELTEDEVRRWQEASTAGELEPITEVIMQLSGLEQDAPKRAMKKFRRRS